VSTTFEVEQMKGCNQERAFLTKEKSGIHPQWPPTYTS
jgi:hypothetical protein